MKYKYLFFLLSVFPLLASGQFAFKNKTDIPVTLNGKTLANPWAGGLNSGQYSTIDLNLDGFDDLIIFDRTSNKLNTFLNLQDTYQYAPEYESLFPPDLNSWLLLVDYNCDGKKDIFSNSTFGMKVYRNISSEQLDFDFVVDPVVTQGFSSEINLQVSNADIPAITDVDGDGDMDVLVFNFVIGGIIEYHQNLSMETDGTCDLLTFKRRSESWGGFTECNCEEISFGGNCNSIGGKAAQPVHAGGKSITAFDTDGDQDVELIIGDEVCSAIRYLENLGTPQNEIYDSFNDTYPDRGQPADFIGFPTAYYEDVDFDGRKDLIIAPNLVGNVFDQVDFRQSSWFYKNIGSTPEIQEFAFLDKSFLQDEMIDVGENAVPAFADQDGDGDLDMILGFRGEMVNGEFYARLSFFENTGSPSQPSFELSDEDYLSLSQLKFKVIKPFFADLNNDGKTDLLVSATSTEDFIHRLHFFPNQSTGLGLVFNGSNPQELPVALAENDNPYFHDIDEDGFIDLLMGKVTGGLEYRRNTGSTSEPTFILENDAFAGIANNSGRRNLVPLIDDINNDGKTELLVTDDSGILQLFTNFQGQSTPQLTTKLIDSELLGTLVPTRIGRQNWMATAALFDTKLPALIIGSIQGGLFMFENVSENGNYNGGNEGPFVLEVFPNPGPPFKIRANQVFSYHLYNTLGQLVTASDQLPAKQSNDLSTFGLSNGIYIIKAQSDSGNQVVRRIVVAE